MSYLNQQKNFVHNHASRGYHNFIKVNLNTFKWLKNVINLKPPKPKVISNLKLILVLQFNQHIFYH